MADNKHEYLIISKEEFKTKLGERIASGIKLLETRVENELQLVDYLDDLGKWYQFNCNLLEKVFSTEDNELANTYTYLNESDRIMTHIIGKRLTNDELYRKEKDYLENDIKCLKDYFEKSNLLLSEVLEQAIITTSNNNNNTLSINNNKVFIVHGHNNFLKLEVARFVSKLKLQEIILSEQNDGGQTVIEKFEANSELASYAIILLSADDLGKAKDNEELNKRARQNVILELGYFYAKLGRDKVSIIHEDGVELPSDIYGILYTKYDGSGAWKTKIAKEMKAAGLTVDMNDL